MFYTVLSNILSTLKYINLNKTSISSTASDSRFKERLIDGAEQGKDVRLLEGGIVETCVRSSCVCEQRICLFNSPYNVQSLK